MVPCCGVLDAATDPPWAAMVWRTMAPFDAFPSTEVLAWGGTAWGAGADLTVGRSAHGVGALDGVVYATLERATMSDEDIMIPLSAKVTTEGYVENIEMLNSEASPSQVHDIVDALYAKHIKTIEQVGGISNEEFASLHAKAESNNGIAHDMDWERRWGVLGALVIALFGMTRRKPCEMPITSMASSSSVTRITPSCAVIEEPERPARPPPARARPARRGSGRWRTAAPAARGAARRPAPGSRRCCATPGSPGCCCSPTGRSRSWRP